MSSPEPSMARMASVLVIMSTMSLDASARLASNSRIADSTSSAEILSFSAMRGYSSPAFAKAQHILTLVVVKRLSVEGRFFGESKGVTGCGAGPGDEPFVGSGCGVVFGAETTRGCPLSGGAGDFELAADAFDGVDEEERGRFEPRSDLSLARDLLEELLRGFGDLVTFDV